jgi:glycerol-1-phosphate dehydrogenase [NAD(P)+]
MELSKLLGTSFTCACGRVHKVPVRMLLYKAGVVGSLPEIVRQGGGGTSVGGMVVVADVRTWDVCGVAVHDTLKKAGLDVSRVIVPDRARGGPICDDTTVQWLLAQLHGLHPGTVVAVGSGVVNDLCKWASFQMGIAYIVVATAASMNGYSSANVAPTVGGVKMLIEARPPVAVIAEPSVVERAPREMTTAGFGDTIAKFQSNSDWITNRLLLGEYYCDLCAGIASSLEPLYLNRPEDIRDSGSEAVKGLFEALFWTGLAMTLVGTSAPASGGEHLLSHTLDMMAEVRGGTHDLHGRQVGIGTLLSAALYERVLAMDSPVIRDMPARIDEQFWTAPSVVAAVTKQYETKRQSHELVRQKIANGPLWDQLRTQLAGTVKEPRVIRDWLTRAGAAVSIDDIGCSRERIRAAILHMHEIRKRFAIVDLAWLVGILPDAVDDLIDQWLTGNGG